MMWKVASILCVGTVLTQLLIAGVLAVRGSLNGDSVTKMVALSHGIDINGNRLQAIFDRAQNATTPSYNEILQKRYEESLDAELRLQNQSNFSEQLQVQLRDLQIREERFDARRDAFNAKLAEMEAGIRDEGLQQLKKTLEVLEPNIAKSQLSLLYDDGEIDTVVNIIQAIAADKRKKIIGEFTSPDDQEKLAEILRRIGQGEPKKSLIEDAKQER